MRGGSALNPLGSRAKAIVDLTLALLAFTLCFLWVPYLNPRLHNAHGFRFVLATASYQFCAESLVPLALLTIRHESFSDYGFSWKKLVSSLRLGLLLALLYDAGMSLYSHALLWVPLRRQPAIRMSLAAALPVSVVGIALTVVVWGFLEGFFGIYFARKVNLLLRHPGGGWFAPGALAFAFFNGGVHVIVGQGLEGFVTSFASGYAIAVVPAVTDNAWGGALVQKLTNAVGKVSH